MDSKQCLLAALHCSWSSEPLFIHRRIGIQSASSLFSLITNKLQFLCMWRLKANYLWETGPEKRERPRAKWFTLVFSIGYWIRWITARYACIIQLFRWRIVALLDSHLLFGHCDAFEICYTFQDMVKVFFFSRGQIKWVEKWFFSVPPSRFLHPPHCNEGFKVRNNWEEMV